MSQFFSDIECPGEVYLVGGPVRDKLLGLKPKDRDWLVVGTTPEAMKAAGFVQVGKDFPVFLHPKTKEEYALARTERKSGQGYQGFVCHTSPDVTLEEDLLRRDFTINAMAMDRNGRLYDPYGGQDDLENRVLRHVSPAFAEDPLRVLRGARFLARLYHLGFRLADATLLLMQQLADDGELNHLSAERVWSESERAMQEKNPEQYLKVLAQVGGVDVWFSELKGCSFDLPDYLLTGVAAQSMSCWAWWLHTLEVVEIDSLCERLRAPVRYRDFARLVSVYWGLLNQEPDRLGESAGIFCLEFLERAGIFRQGGLFDDWLALWNPDQQVLKSWWSDLAEALAKITAAEFVAQGLKGPAIGAAMRTQRLALVAQAIKAR